MVDDDIHPLPGEALEGEHALTLPRARRIVAAARRNGDFTVLGFSRRGGQDGAFWECIRVEVETGGVPTKNKAGIDYRETLAIVVPSDTTAIPRVLALRKSFPVLMHQNEIAPGEPRDLCLYFQPTKVVLREWTPELFVRRIQWWLEHSAKNTLHPADQPVEQLFFVTKYELVLPWNFEEMRQREAPRFSIVKSAPRVDDGITFTLIPGVPSESKPVSFVQLNLGAVVHGQVLSEPANLGQLETILRGRDVDFIEQLKAAIQEPVGDQGRRPADDEKLLLILLNVPIKRDNAGPVERVHRRAYVLLGSLLELGEKLGALVKHAGVYYRDIPINGGQSTGDWQSVPLMPAEVLNTNSAASARQQSGIGEPGPKGTLVGVGALGGFLMMLWGRMGWGEWTVLDKDHVKPHNLSRHLALNFHIGMPKVQVAQQLHDGAMQGASHISSVEADAMAFESPDVQKALQDANLVVDASTTLEYPRAVSSRDDVPRHVSVFLTPNGRDSVLLMEDKERKARLRSLEAQYYRALINNEFGRDHLDGNNGTFWSGAGCRDISFVMPYSLIAVHAGSLADQVRTAALQDKALIRLWKRDATTGQVAAYDVATEREYQFSLQGFDLYFDGGVERRLLELRAAGLPSETGGVLLGYYDFNEGMVVIVDALPAPPDSRASPKAFERGKKDLAATVEEATRRTAGIVKYVGEWHSHPPGYSSNPSPDDRKQLAVLTQEMSSDGLPILQLIVGEKDISIHHGGIH